MKILMTGSTGMLGGECRKVLSEDYDIIAPDKKEMDIVSWDGAIETLQAASPDIVVNCAGLTDVDACEAEPESAHRVNVEGARNMAQCSARFEYKLIHISSDYVFDGQKPAPQPYFEDDVVNPISTYGATKMESETAVRENSPNYVIVRASMLYGLEGHNFIKSILKQGVKKNADGLKVADDQYLSPTWAYRLALQIKQLIKNNVVGTYHATAEGFCTPFEYVEYVFKKMDINTPLVPCRYKDLKRRAKRPLNCVLENRLLKKQGLNLMVDWKVDLDTFLENHGAELIREAESKKN